MTRRARRFLAFGMSAAALASTSFAGTAAAQYALTGPVSAYPSPGTITASPQTTLSFRNRVAKNLGAISVIGSQTGRHDGRIRAHSDGKGGSVVLNGSFRAGETVHVRTNLPILKARNGDYSFRIGRLVTRPVIPNLVLESVKPGKRHRFVTRPDLTPPVVTVSRGARETAPGYLFLSPKSKIDAAQAGPMISDNRGRLVFFGPVRSKTAATDVRAQTYKGEPVLTYWEGTSRLGIGTGDIVIRNSRYEEIRRLRAPNGVRPDLHEFIITPNDTGILVTYPIFRADLSKVGGSRRGQVVDSVLQEVDLETGLVIFEWHSLGKIAIGETFSQPAPAPTIPFDYAHTNSVGLDKDGDFIMSARNTWTIYKIDRETGDIKWRLGGRRSTFKLGAGVRFAWQHDARRREGDGAITVFDNSAFPPVRKNSRALAIRLDETAKTARLISARKHPRGLLSATQGNQQTLPNGSALVGWGSQRYMTEFDRSGRVVWDARLAVGFESYRTYRLPWVGRPSKPPRGVGIRRGAGGMDVYASWNGATEVASWEVLGGSSPSRLTSVGSAPRITFETQIRVPRRTAIIAVRAKDAAGNVLGTSAATRVTAG